MYLANDPDSQVNSGRIFYDLADLARKHARAIAGGRDGHSLLGKAQLETHVLPPELLKGGPASLLDMVQQFLEQHRGGNDAKDEEEEEEEEEGNEE